MQKTVPLQPGDVYHLYNRGNNREDLFREAPNYRYFLELYVKHVHPLVDTFAYCLMRNHFHLLVRIRQASRTTQTSQVSETCEVSSGCEVLSPQVVSQAFSNFFNAYAKGYNKTYQRTGRLFEERFRRIHVQTQSYFMALIAYIHQNPERHGFVEDFSMWEWSSYAAFHTNLSTKVDREEVIAWFGGLRGFDDAHRRPADEHVLRPLIDDDLD